MEIRLLNKEILEKTNIRGLLTDKAPATDVAILSGANIDGKNFAYGYGDLKDRSTDYWLEDNNNGTIDIIKSDGYYSQIEGNKFLGVRPVFKYSEIQKHCKEESCLNNFILATTDFEYPQYVIENPKFMQLINKIAKEEKMVPTGKIYNIGGDNCPEYILDGTKLVFVKKNQQVENGVLSDKISMKQRNGCWCQVDKIQVVVDKENDIAICKNVLLADQWGVLYNKNTVNFEDTYLYKFMNGRLALDFMPSKVAKKISTITIEEAQVKELLNNKEVLLNNGNFKIVVEEPKVKKK